MSPSEHASPSNPASTQPRGTPPRGTPLPVTPPTVAPPTGSPEAAAIGAPSAVNGGAAEYPKWAVHRRLYEWTLALAYRKHATTALFFLSMAESSFFPIPPDVLQAAMTLERRNRAWWYALVSTVGSVIGALIGYLIGWLLWGAVSGFFFRFVFSEEVFESISVRFEEHAFLVVFLAAFTPIPYKAVTVTAGVCAIPMAPLIIGSIVGRGGRFFCVALLLWALGPMVKRFLDKQFNLACLVFGVLLVGGFFLVKYLK